jgi:DNA (cytosine-5)-methyltransferase 1
MRILELFAGSKSFSSVAEELGHEVFTSDYEESFNTDYCVDILQFDVTKLPWKPDVIWASPPCESFSVASILNSKDFGVPQNRERIYFVGHLRGECAGEVFPITNTHRPNTEPVQRHISNTLTARYEAAQATGTYIGESQLNAQKVKSAATRTRAYAGKPEALEIRDDEVSNTINSVTKDYYATDMARIRRLTPLECERLQGFPDDWTKQGIEPCVPDCISCPHNKYYAKLTEISDTQRYKMCGNAVTVNTVQAVMEKLIKHEEV